jgi:hypothetical protein
MTITNHYEQKRVVVWKSSHTNLVSDTDFFL